MNLGFKVQLPPPPPPVLAGESEQRCGERHVGEHVRCDRPEGHAGGHLNRNADLYWQQAEGASS